MFHCALVFFACAPSRIFTVVNEAIRSGFGCGCGGKVSAGGMGDGVARGFGGASVFGAGGGAFAAEGCHGGEVCVCVYEKVVLVRMGGCGLDVRDDRGFGFLLRIDPSEV